MGDSGYLILRKVGTHLEELFKSEDLQHEFNLPYQVGTKGDNPQKAHVESHILYPGDIIILATDGLWDNVENEIIKEIIGNNQRETQAELDIIARKIATVAHENSMDTKKFSPFAAKAWDKGYALTGGKLDDITVIVAQVMASML